MRRAADLSSTMCGQWVNQSHLCNGATKKPLNEEVWKASQLLTYPCAGRVTPPNSMGTEASVLRTLLDLVICVSSSGYLFVSFKISFVIN